MQTATKIRIEPSPSLNSHQSPQIITIIKSRPKTTPPKTTPTKYDPPKKYDRGYYEYLAYQDEIAKVDKDNIKAGARKFTRELLQKRKEIAQHAILDAFISPEDDPAKLQAWIEGLMYVKPELAAGVLKALLSSMPIDPHQATAAQGLAPLIINNINHSAPLAHQIDQNEITLEAKKFLPEVELKPLV